MLLGRKHFSSTLLGVCSESCKLNWQKTSWQIFIEVHMYTGVHKKGDSLTQAAVRSWGLYAKLTGGG